MKIEQFSAGEFRPCYQYSCFLPSLVNQDWSWDSRDLTLALERSVMENVEKMVHTATKKSKPQLLTNCKGLKLRANDGKLRLMDCFDSALHLSETLATIERMPETTFDEIVDRAMFMKGNERWRSG